MAAALVEPRWLFRAVRVVWPMDFMRVNEVFFFFCGEKFVLRGRFVSVKQTDLFKLTKS